MTVKQFIEHTIDKYDIAIYKGSKCVYWGYVRNVPEVLGDEHIALIKVFVHLSENFTIEVFLP